MRDWIVLAGLPLLVSAVLLIVPGYLTARSLAFRGLLAWALAGPVSVAVLAAASILSPIVGLPWSAASVAAVTLVACGIAWTLRLAWRSKFTPPSTPDASARWAIVIALAIGAILVAVQFVLIVGDPRNFSQTYDNIFHLNAVRYALETGNASPIHISRFTRLDSAGLAFYPAAWHGAVALVSTVTGTSAAVASNAVMLAAGTLIWPASVLMLAIVLFGRSRAFVMAVGVLSAAAPAFPILMIDFGVLYPYFLALCVLPAAVAATLVLLRLGERSPSISVWQWLIAGFAVVSGLLLVHPAAFVAWLLLAGVAAIVAFVRLVRSRPPSRRVWIAGAALAVAGIISVFLWRSLRPQIDENLWPPSQTVGQAIGEVLTLSMERAQIPLFLTAAMIVGVVVALRRGTLASRLAVGYLAILMALFVVTTSMQWLGLRRDIAAAWYDNSPRLAALIPMMAVPLAALGIEALWRWIVRRAPDRLTTPGTPAYASLIAVGSVVLVLGTQFIAIPSAIERAQLVYIPSATSPLLTTDELALIRQLPGLVPEDAVVTGNPGTGTAMVYALTGIEVLHPAVVVDMSDDIALIDGETDEASSGSAVCQALDRERVGYVLDFGAQEINGESHSYPGYDDLSTSESVELVKSVGKARLYRIVGCDGS